VSKAVWHIATLCDRSRNRARPPEVIRGGTVHSGRGRGHGVRAKQKGSRATGGKAGPSTGRGL